MSEEQETIKLLGGVITWGSVAILLVAAFFWTLPLILPLLVPSVAAYTRNWWWIMIEGMMRLLSGAVVAGILVDFFLHAPKTMAYVEGRMRSAVAGESYVRSIISQFAAFNISQLGFLKSLTVPILTKARSNIIRVTNNIDFPEYGMFYKTLTQKIEPLLGMPHIELMDMVIHNYVEEVEGRLVIRSDRTTTFDFHTRNSAKIDVGFERRILCIPGISTDQLYRLSTFKVGSEYLGTDWTPPAEGSTYCLVEKPYMLAMEADSTTRVLVKETVLLPPSDFIYWKVRPDRSVRRLKVTCDFNEDVNPRLLVYGFASPEADDEAEHDERSCSIDWSGWMVPFHNFIITWDDPQPRQLRLPETPRVTAAEDEDTHA